MLRHALTRAKAISLQPVPGRTRGFFEKIADGTAPCFSPNWNPHGPSSILLTKKAQTHQRPEKLAGVCILRPARLPRITVRCLDIFGPSQHDIRGETRLDPVDGFYPVETDSSWRNLAVLPSPSGKTDPSVCRITKRFDLCLGRVHV